MRVLFVSQECPPETAWGGIGTYVGVLSKELARTGADVHVVSIVEGQRPSTTTREGVTVHRLSLPRVRGPGRVMPETWRRLWLPAVVARRVTELVPAPSVVECPEWNAEGLWLALRGRMPLVVRLHSSARQLFAYTGQGTGVGGLDGRLAARLEEISARRANVVISTAANLAETRQWMGLDERAVHAIPYPIPLPEPIPLDPAAPPRVTFVGRLEPRKAPEIVLRAAPRVLAAVPETRFVFVGRDGIHPGAPSSAAWLEREAERLGVRHAVELTGQLDAGGLARELRRATVCAFPSKWESFGNVVGEAAALGRPVVVSAIAPFRELVQDGITGRIVDGEREQDWADAVIELLRDRDQARRCGLAGADRIASISAPKRVAALTVTAYEQAMARWHRGECAGRHRVKIS